nr:hypothetical protein [Aminobacter anthyllidis]
MRRHQRQEFIAQAGRQAGEIIGGIPNPAAGEVDDSRYLAGDEQGVASGMASTTLNVGTPSAWRR